jgi:hypothetical protein
MGNGHDIVSAERRRRRFRRGRKPLTILLGLHCLHKAVEVGFLSVSSFMLL